MPLPITADGNLIYEPDGQVLRDFFHDRSRVAIIQGPIGSGTSSCCCHRIWATALEQEPDLDGVRRSHWLISRESYPQLEKTTVRTWLEWFPEAIFGPFRMSKPMQHKIEMPHPSGDGTKIELLATFMPLEDVFQAVSDLASLELTGVWLNEMQFMEKEILDEALSRCSRYPSMRMGPGPTWYGLIGDLNAPNEGHFLPYMRGDIPMPEEWDVDTRDAMDKPKGWRFFVQPPGLLEVRINGRLVYRENPLAENQKWLKEPYLEKIIGKDKEWVDRQVLNKNGMSRSGMPVYPTFTESDHIAPSTISPIPNYPIIVGLDFGREPAAIFCQNLSGSWKVYSEIIGHNESAELFSPKVRQHLMRKYPGFRFELYGDPRGADGAQNVEITAYQVYQKFGLHVIQASSDNNPELRRTAVEGILDRRNGLQLDPNTCPTFKQGMVGGFHYPRIKGSAGMHSPKPLKNRYSHIVDAFENATLGAGEGRVVLTGGAPLLKPHRVKRKRYSLRKHG